MKKLFYALTAILLLSLSACDSSVKPIETGEATNITQKTAVLSGSVNPAKVDPGTAMGIVLSTEEGFAAENVTLLPASSLDENNSFSVEATGLKHETIYFYKAYLGEGENVIEGEVKSFTTEPLQVIAVDLGLSVKWADMNVGATSPEEAGGHYTWGETETKSHYHWDSHKWCNGTYTSLTKYCKKDKKTVLEPEDDAAHVALGGNWRTPTDAEWAELKNKCTWTWTSVNGINGYQVSSSNGNSIFLPVTDYTLSNEFMHTGGNSGFYWAANVEPSRPHIAKRMVISRGSIRISGEYRSCGYAVRPVSD